MKNEDIDRGIFRAELKERDQQIKALQKVLKKTSGWVLWLSQREKCSCEQNSRCVTCITKEDYKQIEQVLKGK